MGGLFLRLILGLANTRGRQNKQLYMGSRLAADEHPLLGKGGGGLFGGWGREGE